MAINKKGVFETLAHKISNLDSNSSTSVIIDTLKAVKKADHNTILSYADSSGLPTASASNYRLAYINDIGQLRFNNGLQWDKLVTQLPSKATVHSLQGSTSGYTSGGYSPSPATYTNIIDKFSFTSDGDATDVGDLTVARYGSSGQSSTSHGYTSSGAVPFSNVIDKFSFTSDGNATDVGDVTEARYGSAGQSSSTHGYACGGYLGGDPENRTNIIEKFPFATDENVTDVGNLTQIRNGGSGQTSSSHGYTSGGRTPPNTYVNTVDKFPFSTDTDASDVGDLSLTREYSCGQSSTTHGYAAGGRRPSYQNTIDKFTFSSDENATDVGDLSTTRAYGAGQSSTSDGYHSGGLPAPGANVIDKFTFTSDANASDIGNLTVGRYFVAGQQV